MDTFTLRTRERETSTTSSIKKAFQSILTRKNSNIHSRQSSQVSVVSSFYSSKEKKSLGSWIKSRLTRKKEQKDCYIPEIHIEPSTDINTSEDLLDQGHDSLEPIILQKRISIKRESSHKDFKARFGRFVFNEIHPKQESRQKSVQEITILKPSKYNMTEEDTLLSSSKTLYNPDRHLHPPNHNSSSIGNFFSSSQSSFLNLFASNGNGAASKKVSPALSRRNLFSRNSNSTLQLSIEEKMKPRIHINQILYKLQQDPLIKNKIIQCLQSRQSNEQSIHQKPSKQVYMPKRNIKNLPLPTLNVDPLHKISTSQTDLFELERQLEREKLSRQMSRISRTRTNQYLPKRARELSLWSWFSPQKQSPSSATLHSPSRRPSSVHKTNSVIELQNIPT